MSILDKILGVLDTEKTSKVSLVSPNTVFKEVLKKTSGSAFTRDIKYNLFYQIYAFKGVVEGVGCSTLVANTALAIADTGLSVCVIDTSILRPVQDVLLKTSVEIDTDENLEKALDWFDMPYTEQSPLHISQYKKNISVLSFKGKHRGIVDFLSTADSVQLVELALTKLHDKFDIILIDCCDEVSSINTACLQQAHQVIQVWNDTPTVVSNLENFITQCITLSCPLDKMRYVVYSKMCRDVIGNLDSLVHQYRCKHLATSYMSEEIYLAITSGRTLYQLTSTDQSIIDYTECIISIVCHILNIKEDTNIGTITSNDIMDGKVEGTLSKAYKDSNDTHEVIFDDSFNSKTSQEPQEVNVDFGVTFDDNDDVPNETQQDFVFEIEEDIAIDEDAEEDNLVSVGDSDTTVEQDFIINESTDVVETEVDSKPEFESVTENMGVIVDDVETIIETEEPAENSEEVQVQIEEVVEEIIKTNEEESSYFSESQDTSETTDSLSSEVVDEIIEGLDTKPLEESNGVPISEVNNTTDLETEVIIDNFEEVSNNSEDIVEESDTNNKKKKKPKKKFGFGRNKRRGGGK